MTEAQAIGAWVDLYGAPSLQGAHILGYAAAFDAAHGKARVIDDLLRLWSGVPTRHQFVTLRAQERANRIVEAIRARQLADFAKAGAM